ncbi:MAG TPA: nickel pincer cofactor biosynthesis protein LarC [Mycobacteriales bacterium]|nr:nickel pincer cofactor biosynthesis protein LarC [Mycobacteriales bacterium]
MSRVGWLHCLAGASGDMVLGALVDAGAPLEIVQAAVDAVDVEPVLVSRGTVTRAGVAATKIEVSVPRTRVVRTWANVRDVLERAALDDAVRALALDVFARLAHAEARAHRTEPEQVHFHEVGALDALADVVGSAAALHALRLDRLVASPVVLGFGMARGEHGLLPVPGPAVLALLGDVDAPVYSGDVAAELCTPTGAALLAATVRAWGGLPPMRVKSVGTGAGERDFDQLPNVLRLVVGEAATAVAPAPEEELLIECNVDDLDPRVWPAVLSSLLDAGAADAWLTPILMKKGRPAHTLSILVAPPAAEAVRGVVFRETSAIGLREVPVAKRALARGTETVSVDGCPVRVKTARLGEVVVNVQPEYDDVAAAAVTLDRPVKAVLAAAVAAAYAAGLAP